MKIDLKIEKEIKNELKYLLTLVAVILIILKIAFYKETLINVLKFGLTFVYFSLLPGYFVLFNVREHLARDIRFALAFPIGFALYTLIAYYLNIFINLKYVIFLPLLIIFISITYAYYNLNILSKKNILALLQNFNVKFFR